MSCHFFWFHRIGIDLVGPLKETPRGNKYIITCTDYMSKWPEAEPLRDKSAEGVANFLYKLICRHGCPNIIQSDQGREFVNQIEEKLCKLTGVEQRISSAYHPQTNGLDERMNQTISRALSKYINDDQNDWDLFLDPILFAYRTSIQSSSKFTPFFLMYGRRARLPVEVSGEQSSDPSGNDHATDDTTTWYVSCNIYTYTYNSLYLFFLLYSHDFDSHVTKMLEFHSQVLTKAKGNIVDAQRRQKEQYDKKHAGPTGVTTGSTVLLQNAKNKARKGGKQDPLWLGPYTVEQISDTGVCKLRNRETGKRLQKAYNVSLLTLYKERQPEGKNTGRHNRHATNIH